LKLLCFANLGIGRTEEMDRLHLNPYDGTRVQYNDPITAFPNKMDELLVALNKVREIISIYLVFYIEY
jgi:hypothetical protein